MVPLYVVMRYEFSNGVSQCILTKEDNLIQTARTPPYSESDGHDERRSICGSADIYAKSGKGPSMPVHFVVLPVGIIVERPACGEFVHKHNAAYGENNHDGTDYNSARILDLAFPKTRSTYVGIAALRKGQIKNFLLTLLSRVVCRCFSAGTIAAPGRQNNAYCQVTK